MMLRFLILVQLLCEDILVSNAFRPKFKIIFNIKQFFSTESNKFLKINSLTFSSDGPSEADALGHV